LSLNVMCRISRVPIEGELDTKVKKKGIQKPPPPLVLSNRYGGSWEGGLVK